MQTAGPFLEGKGPVFVLVAGRLRAFGRAIAVRAAQTPVIATDLLGSLPSTLEQIDVGARDERILGDR